MKRRSATEAATATTNMVDHASATSRCNPIPAATPPAPIVVAAGPSTVAATPCHRRLNVDPYANTLSMLAHTKSHAAVTSQVARIAAPTDRRGVVSGRVVMLLIGSPPAGVRCCHGKDQSGAAC